MAVQAADRGAEQWTRKAPLEPALWPHAGHFVNRARLFDFYAKEADFFAAQLDVLSLILPEFPGLDGPENTHWGNQDEESWKDARWNQTDHGPVVSNVWRGANMTLPKAVAVCLGEEGTEKVSAVFNPLAASWDAVWKGGFVTFSEVRGGFMDGARMEGIPISAVRSAKPPVAVAYHGFYRHGQRVIFSYALGGQEMLDSMALEKGAVVRTLEPAGKGALAALTHGGPAQWPQLLETRGERGAAREGDPFAIDTLTLPFDNPWKTLLCVTGHDFFPDGKSAAICTMTGEVWTVAGVDDTLASLRWRRFATGLHQPLGLRIIEGKIHVLGRNQLTRLHDLNGDGEADFYECVSNAYETSPGGHDFNTGLEVGPDGWFYFASATQGVCRLSPDGQTVESLATGFRNANGVAVSKDGVVVTNGNEGEWSNASAVYEITRGGFYGYGGPKKDKETGKPLVQLPRGFDNSTGGGCFIEEAAGENWAPFRGSLINTSYGAGTAFFVLRDVINGVAQGCAVGIPGSFRSGAHRARFSPHDGHLYVSGSRGWGTYTPDDGSFQRVRLAQTPVFPVSWRACDNGVLLTFAAPVDAALAGDAGRHFAQMWNYRYAADYGSPEFSVLHPGVAGHDPLEIRSAQVLEGGRALFLEMPQLRPANQLHLRLRVGGPRPLDVFATIHALHPPFTDFPGYQPIAKTATPDAPLMTEAAGARENPWAKGPPGRAITLEAALGLQFAAKRLSVAPGEALSLTFVNPDLVPHNFVLVQPGALKKAGEAINKLIAQPGAAARHYVPDLPEVLAWTDMVNPRQQTTIHFRAPLGKGEYPYLCSFPGHWQVMHGVLVIE